MLGLAVLGVSGAWAVLAWLDTPPAVDLSKRVPGMDAVADLGPVKAEPVEPPRLDTFGGEPAPQLKGQWLQFRGPKRENIAQPDVELARSWPTGGPKVLWQRNLGEGHAGAVVRDGRVWVVDYDEDAERDVIRCMSLADGKDIWAYSYAVKIKWNHGMSRTIPTLAGKYIVTIGPKCHVACLEADTGKLVWFKDMVKEYGTKVPAWYAGQCPLIEDGVVVLAPAGKEAMFVGLDLATGEERWRTPNPWEWDMTHVSILKMSFAGKSMYVYSAKKGVVAVSADQADRGKVLWSTNQWWVPTAAVSCPLDVGDGKVFLSGGYGKGSAMLQMTAEGGEIKTAFLWKGEPPEFFGSEQQTPIFKDGLVYGVMPKNIGGLSETLVCMNLDGSFRWSSGRDDRFGLGPFLMVGNLMYLMDDHGRLTLAEVGPDGYRRLARAEVLPRGEDSWAPMALAGGRLILRDRSRMVCLDVTAGN